MSCLAEKQKNKLEIPKNIIKVIKASTANKFLLHILQLLIPQRSLLLKQTETRVESNITICHSSAKYLS